MDEDIDLAKQWLDKAQSDLLNVDNNLKSEKIPFDTVCFHCQQAAEKMLKAYLVANQKPYPVSHDLLLILEQIRAIDPGSEKLRETLTLLMPYAVEIRYPDDYYMPSAEDAAEARQAAAKIYDWLKETCQKLFSD